MHIDHGVVSLNFWVTEYNKVKNYFGHPDLKIITVINLKIGTDTQLKSNKMNLQWASRNLCNDFLLPLCGSGRIMPCLAVLLFGNAINFAHLFDSG